MKKKTVLFAVIALFLMIGGMGCETTTYTQVEPEKTDRYSGWETIHTFKNEHGVLLKVDDDDCICYVDNANKPSCQHSRLLYLVGLPDKYKIEGLNIIFSGELKNDPLLDMYMPGWPVILTELKVKK